MYGRNNYSKCLECQGEAKGKQFCSAICRSSFHNRRTKRGALVYDVMMIALADPEAFAQGNFKARLQVQLTAWRAEDTAAGRLRTWSLSREVGYDLPHVSGKASS